MDVVVIGAGVIGLAVTKSLIDLGVRVRCMEAAVPMGQRSTGRSRIFRTAHATGDLIQMAQRSRIVYDRWSSEAAAPLLTEREVVLCGPEVGTWASAMDGVAAPHDVVDSSSPELNLPLRRVPGPALIDRCGGVLDSVAVGRYLLACSRAVLVIDHAYQLEAVGERARVRSIGGVIEADAVVVAGGAATAQLAAQVGVYLPTSLLHHVRFTFPFDDSVPHPQSLIEKSGTWRPGFGTYQHLLGPGAWAVGVHLDPAHTAWEVGRDAVLAHSRELAVAYARENLIGVRPVPTDELYCTVSGGWDDGFLAERNGPFIALHGDNLFKFAPVLGEMLAAAAVDGSIPQSVRSVAPAVVGYGSI